MDACPGLIQAKPTWAGRGCDVLGTAVGFATAPPAAAFPEQRIVTGVGVVALTFLAIAGTWDFVNTRRASHSADRKRFVFSEAREALPSQRIHRTRGGSSDRHPALRRGSPHDRDQVPTVP